MPVFELVEPMRVSATPATPASPEPMKKVVMSVVRLEIPLVSARSRCCTTARMRRPHRGGVLHRDGDRDHGDDGQQHDEQAGLGNHRTEDVDTARQPRRRGHVDRGRTEDVAGELLQDESDAERHQQGVEGVGRTCV